MRRALLFLVFLPFLALATQVTISNVVPRTSGSEIMDIHDGNVLIIGGVYYWYGASYGNCKEPAGPNGCADASIGQCGFQTDHNVSLYTSNDLVDWTFQGHVFSASAYSQPAILFCPKVIYNPATKLYVLWGNWIGGSFADSYYSAATSPSPMGPFKLVNENITMGNADTGDFNLFLDDDGSGYVIYTSHIQGYSVTHQMSVEKLAPDFTTTLGLAANSGFFGASFVEAPAMFKANNTYYAVFGQCCCYCQSGSPVYVHSASSPLGPYTTLNSLGSSIPAQQTDIISYYSSPGELSYIWIGDRWQSAPDGIKGHDFTYWGPIIFSNGNIEPLPFDNNFTISVYVQ